MLDILKTTAVAAAVAVAALPASVSAATLMVDGGSYNINSSSEFFGNVSAAGGAGQWQVEFTATADPLNGTASATIGPIVLGTFTNLVMSWINWDATVLASTSVGVGSTTLSTTFSTTNGTNPQYLNFAWDDSQAGAGFDVEVSAVPLPAGGLLLIGALGGLAALRRRKNAA